MLILFDYLSLHLYPQRESEAFKLSI